MTYEELQEAYGMSDFLSGETVIESCVMEENINGEGKLSLTWRQDVGGGIPIGTTMEVAGKEYVLLETYAPTSNGDGSYSFSPQFTEEGALASKTVFSMAMQTRSGETVTLYSFPYSGGAGTLVSALDASLKEQTGMGVRLGEGVDGSAIISVSIDGESVKSVCDKVAAALGVNAYFCGGVLQIGGSNAYSADEYYNRFIVLGGTRNMGKKTLRGSYAQVTQRLTLGESGESVIDLSDGEPRMTKILVFDDVFPKIELVVRSVGRRECYILDERGEKVVDYETAGGGVVYKTYTKWYVTLGLDDGDGVASYSIPTEAVIEGQPLGLLFQSGLLAGREFDLAYFGEETVEHGSDDVNPLGYRAASGSCRIVMQADGATLLPNDVLKPVVGDKVTLLNVGMEAGYYAKARKELRERAEEYVKLYHSKKVAQYESAGCGVVDFLSGESALPSVGSSAGVDGEGYVVTSVKRDLIGGSVSYTFGTFKKRGVLQSLVDKVEGLQLSGGGASVGSVAEESRSTCPIGEDSWKALRDTLGDPGLVATNRWVKEIETTVGSYGSDLAAVKEQSDKKFEIHFYAGEPGPRIVVSGGSGYLSGAESGPSEEWDTEEARGLHVQDICYDTSRAAGSSGGRAWRWLQAGTDGAGRIVVSGGSAAAYDASVHAGYVYGWGDITDQDTVASLEKISDVASDGVLSGGTEKVRILGDWLQAVQEWVSYGDATSVYGSGADVAAAVSAYREAFLGLGKMLNGGVEGVVDASGEVVETPLFVRDTSVDTRLRDYSYDVAGEAVEMTPDYYRGKWEAYWRAKTVLLSVISGEVKQVADRKMECHVSEEQPAPPYRVGDEWRRGASAASEVYICVRGREAGEAGEASDWQREEAREAESVTRMLAELGAVLAEDGESGLEGVSMRRVALSEAAPSDVGEGDLWYDGERLEVQHGGGWSSVASTTLLAAAGGVLRLMGYGVTIRFFMGYRPEAAQKYDVELVRAEYWDSFTHSTVEGGIGVWVYTGRVWEHVMENVSGLLKNYGDHLIASIFGTSGDGETNYASGLTTRLNFAEMFAEAADAEGGGELPTRAGISVHVEEDEASGERRGYVDVTGTLRSGDGKFRVEGKQAEADVGDGLGSSRRYVGLEMGDEESPNVALVYEERHNDLGHGSYERCRLEMESRELTRSGYWYHRGVVSPELIGSSSYAIIDVREEIDVESGTGEQVERLYSGVGSVDEPVRFETVDGKVVTVIGGIVTSVEVKN